MQYIEEHELYDDDGAASTGSRSGKDRDGASAKAGNGGQSNIVAAEVEAGSSGGGSTRV